MNVCVLLYYNLKRGGGGCGEASRSLEQDDNARHVIASDATGGVGVLGQDLGEHVLDVVGDRGGWFGLGTLVIHKVNALLVGETVPDAVTGDHQEIKIRATLDLSDVGTRSYHLFLIWQFRVALVFEIADRARQIEDPVHAVVFHEPVRVFNPLAL